jgi:hypothetical protein
VFEALLRQLASLAGGLPVLMKKEAKALPEGLV